MGSTLYATTVGLTVIRGLVPIAIAGLVGTLLRRYFAKSPLDPVPGPPASSVITGNIGELFDVYGWKYHYGILKQYGSVIKVRGLFGERSLYLCDPKALHHVLVKDQHAYEGAAALVNLHKICFGDGLLSTLGEQHRKQRKMLNPVFSIAHMREMMPIFHEVTSRLQQAIYDQVKDAPKEIDILHWMSRTALELIGQSGMGCSFDSLDVDAKSADLHPFSRSVKQLGTLFGGLGGFLVAQFVFPLVNRINLPRFKRWIADRLPLRWVQDVKNVVDIIQETAEDICNAKRKATLDGRGDDGKKDIISILIRANASAAEEDRLSDGEVHAQVATITFGAVDTTSSALSRTLWLLAEHPGVQEKLRTELREAKGDNGGEELGYDQLVSLPYLDAVCRETLRVYPPVANTIRDARKDMILPLSKPIKTTTGAEVSELVVPSGTTLFLSLLGANTNPDMWGEDAYEWKPERWLNPLPEKVSEAHMPGIYSHLMTFLGGSRACIGFKFSQLEMKAVLSVLLASFRFESAEKKIRWKLSGISAPVVEEKGTTRSSLPMMISSLDQQ
ncbi:cytochrome P450 [Macrolepiota fuliginosa MF-IS2]|uniref:Cytochrome P450 n=1 Tax=Macrolepiota fuliginosa MF-IS2 TaxID=1400762 RepID=A0A9P5X4H4_9AGAR|nr:cytochrome P450 [Macrolepiota fuliginosa MF-IS2]